MKKMFLAAILALVMAGTAAAQDTLRRMFNYYPKENFYYDQASGNYFYYDSLKTSWSTVRQLPATYHWSKQDPYEKVYYNGNDVWMDNAAHRRKYGKTKPEKKQE